MVKKKIISILLAVCLVFSGMYVTNTVKAGTQELKMVTTLSSTTAKIGDTIKVTVSLDNYANIGKTIDAYKISMNVDTNYFEFVKVATDTTVGCSDSFTDWYTFNKSTNSAEKYENGVVSAEFSDAKVHLDTTTTKLISFDLKVKSTITADALSNLVTSATVVYTGNSSSNPTAITSVGADLSILTEAPKVSLTSNDTVHNNSIYNDNVTVNLNKGSGEIYKDGTKVADVSPTTPYLAADNGSYSIKNVKDIVGNIAVDSSFSISLGVKSISMQTAPAKTSYIEGTATSVDPTNGVVKITYNNNTTSTVDLTAAMCTGYDLSIYSTATASQAVTVTYQGKTTNFNVSVVKKSLSSIKVTKNPDKTIYSQGTAINVTGGEITLSYDNNTSEVIPMTSNMIQSPDMTTTGTKNVSVTYLGKSTTYAITVNEKVISNFTLNGNSNLSVTEGMKLDLSGVTADLTYDNGSVDKGIAVTSSNSTYTDVPGVQTVTVTFGDIKKTFTITVNAKVASSIAMYTLPKTNYKEGDSFSISGAQIIVTYNNGTKSAPIDVTTSMISPSTPSMSNYDVEQTVTVTYDALTTSYKYTVATKKLNGISVTAPTKVTYVEKNTLLTDGGFISLNYDNNTSKKIDLTTAYCSGYDMKTVGNQTVTVTYSEGSIEKTATFNITVNAKSLSSISVNSNPTETTVLEGKTLSLSGGVLNLTYDNADTSTVDMTKAAISGFDSNKVGSQVVTLTYEGKTATLNVTVKAKTLTGITVKAPTKTTYLTSQNLDTTGMKVVAAYDNDTSTEVAVSANGITGYDNSKVGSQTITVTYGDKTANFTVKVLSRDALNAVNNNITTLQGKTLTVANDDVVAVTALRTAYNALSSVEQAEVDESKIIALENTMKALLYPAVTAKNADSSVTVVAPIGSISYAAKVIIAGITNSDALSSLLSKVNEKSTNPVNLLSTFDLTCVKANDSSVKVALKGSVEVTITLNDTIKATLASLAPNERLIVAYISDNGTLEDMNAVFSSNTVSYATTHFSTYSIIKITEPVASNDTVGSKDTVVNNATPDSTNTTSSSGVQTGDTTNIYAIILAMVCSGGFILRVRRKKITAK